MMTKRLLALLLVFVMLLGSVPVVGASMVEAEPVAEYTEITPLSRPAAATGNVANRLEQLQRRFPGGSYFSVNRRACGHGEFGTCNNCNLTAIMRSMGYPNAMGNRDGWTCVAFARYAFWWIFGVAHNVAAYGSAIPAGTSTVSRANARPGDMFIWDNRHMAIYLGNNRFYDSNSAGATNRVFHGRTLNFGAPSRILRANNYDAINGPQVPTAVPGNVRANGHAGQAASVAPYVFYVTQGDTITISWNAVSGATRYRIEPLTWSATENRWVAIDGQVREVTATSVAYTTLPVGAWGFRIRAGNTAGWSTNAASWFKVSVSAPREVPPPTPTPPPPVPSPSPTPTPPSNNALPFRDVRTSDSFYQAVRYVFENNLMNGTSATTFEPHTTLTRSMVAAIVYRMAGEPSVAFRTVFTDVRAGQWYSASIIWASDNGIVNGVGDGRFAPNQQISREELAVMMHRYAVSRGQNVTVPTHVQVPVGTAPWAVDAMRWAIHHGFLVATGPQNFATRAEVAVFIHRFDQQLLFGN